MPPANIYDDAFEYDPADPPGFRGGVNRLSRALGGEEIVMKLFELRSGERLCPYHYEFVEEWLILIEGELEVRTPTGTTIAHRGDVLRFPAGPDGAHTVTTTSAQEARFIMFSSSREPSVAVYPDSDKIGVWAGDLDLMIRGADTQTPYYEGET